MSDDSYRCRSCRTTTDDLDDMGSPRGWYRLQLKADRFGDGDAKPGWYCSVSCLTLSCMLALGIDRQDALAWLRG